jgi:DNA-binding transcriptional LysR family regulator
MSFRTFDLNLLRVFDAVMTEQNLTRAAERLVTTQPAVSNALKRLRETLDDELLVRTAHGMKPTARAEELWPAVRQALSSLEAAIAPENFDVSETHATFRLAMADSTASLLLPRLMRAIKQEAPGLDIRMLPLTTRDPRAMLLQSDIDLAIGNFPGVVAQLSGGQSSVSAIRHQRLYSSESVCIMRKDHPLAATELTVDSYCAAHHALVSFSGRAHGPADEALAAMGRQRRIALTVNQF